MTSHSRKAKYCPQCGTMTYLDAKTCVRCGHAFKTHVPEAPPTFDTHRTQMLTLPPVLSRPPRDQTAPVEVDPPLLPDPVLPRRTVPLPAVLLVGLIVLLLGALVWWLARQGV